MPGPDRRTFLQSTGLTAAAAALAGFGPGPAAAAAAEPGHAILGLGVSEMPVDAARQAVAALDKAA
jgi:hypothetical protein